MKKRINLICCVAIIIVGSIFAIKYAGAKKAATYTSRHEAFALQYFYDIDSETGELVISDPAAIAALEKWDKYGCRYIYSLIDSDFSSNDEFMSAMRSDDNPDEWRLSVINALYVMLAEDEFVHSGELDQLTYDSKLKIIEQRRSYTADEINDAMEVFVFGANNVDEDNRYDSIMAIPYDLQNACIFAMDESSFTGIEMIHAWRAALVEETKLD